MFKAIVLICAMSTPSGECTRQSAVRVQPLPKVATLQQCMFGAQTTIAEADDVAPKPGEEYAKVVCDDPHRVATR